MQDVTLLIPTFNEEESIKGTLDYVLRLYPDINIIIADEGSTDRTHELVKPYCNDRVQLLDRTYATYHGLTVSIMEAAMLVKTPYFIVMDADLQHPPEKLKEIHAMLLAGKDVVVGARPSLPKEWSFFRRTQSNIANWLAQIRLLLTGKCTPDPISGFFGGRTDLFQNVIQQYEHRFVKEGFKILVDYLKLLPKSTKVGIVHFTFRMRENGTSKIGKKHVIAHLKSLIT